MADSFEMRADLVRVIDNDQVVFEASDDRRTLSYWPDEAISGTKSVAFHNPPQDTAYWWTGGTAPSGSPQPYLEKAASFKTLLSQECGPPGIPNVTYDLTFANILLGTVPAGTNYLDIQVRLTRTKDPDNFFDQPVRAMQPQGQWMSCPGYALPLEKMKEFRRHIDIVLDGTNVYLRRYQSTQAVTGGIAYDPNNDPNANGGWTYTTTPSGTTFVLLAYSGEYRATQNWARRRSDSTHLIFDDATRTDLGSTWQVEYVITPGRLDTTAVPPVTPKPSIRFGGNKFTHTTLAANTVRSWTGVNLLFAKSTRYVVAKVSAYGPFGGGAITCTGVTIGGVGATKILERTNSAGGYGHSLWIAAVPTGTSATVTATWNDTAYGQSLSVFSLYDLTSATPYTTAAYNYTSSDFTSLNINAPADGVVLGVASGTYGIFDQLAGIEDVYSEFDNFGLTGSRGAMRTSSGQEETPSAITKTLTCTQFGTAAIRPEAVLAASFR